MAIPPQFLKKKDDKKANPFAKGANPFAKGDPKKDAHHKAKNAAVAKLAAGKKKDK